MTIDWNALWDVFAWTLLSTIGLVGVFTLGILGMSRREGGEAAVLNRAGGWICFAACAAAVAYGIHLIVSK